MKSMHPEKESPSCHTLHKSSAWSQDAQWTYYTQKDKYYMKPYKPPTGSS